MLLALQQTFMRFACTARSKPFRDVPAERRGATAIPDLVRLRNAARQARCQLHKL